MRVIKKRRRLENKTDYKARLGMLKANANRIVIRKTNRYLILQEITSKEAQDRVIKTITTRDLLQYGWPENMSGSLKSIPACYLAGFLLAKSMKDKAIIDIGMYRNIKGNRIYAAVKGLVDGGAKINAGNIAPKAERIKGEHMKQKIDVEKIKESINHGKK